MNVARGDTVYIVEPTPYHVVRVVPSTNSVLTHPAFDSRHCSFFVGISALRAPPKPVTELVVNTDHIQKCNLCSPVPHQILPDVMNRSTIKSPPLTSTIGSTTDSVKHRELAALLREPNKIECLEQQSNECFSLLDRQQERLTRMTTQGQSIASYKQKLAARCSQHPVPLGGYAKNQQNL